MTSPNSSADSDRDLPALRFRPTNGGFVGVLGIAGCVCVAGVALWWDPSLRGVRIAVTAGWAAWAVGLVLLRPCILLDGKHLVLRGTLSEVRIPLPLLTAVQIGLYTRVWCGERSYASAAVGRGRPTRSPGPAGEGRSFAPSRNTIPDLVETRLRRVIASHADGPTPASDPAPTVATTWGSRPLLAWLLLGVVVAVTWIA